MQKYSNFLRPYTTIEEMKHTKKSNLKQRMIDDIFGASLQRAMLQNLDDFEKILSG